MQNDNFKNLSQDLKLITCVIQRGKGDKLTKAAIDAGAGGVTAFFARGIGVRDRLGLLGLAIVPEKEVLLIVCHSHEVERILPALVKAGDLNTPGHGIAYVTPIDQVVGYIPT
ncbi:MAG: P-II family nitrogen regulator [Desulfobacterales bacterium]|jgi:nitrogen regulatory protein PII|nr:P-II family nitrogen regulator [Desulfobacterales bacterium]